ncbi:MAG: hypothetical protein A3E01_03985 [Gammaproteobacteria bacterium RIFCSPHIGHO2_12_FULL_63_22]|nr:MAG: hypothetical protein A3E01_03985 [Gammaproteobacteria bacterium RIFCSPHIGHO2_12_FULL_63_22]
MGISSGAALAGEVAGPPGSQDPRSTGAPDNSNSNCSYSGLNDYDPDEGQNESIVQTVADAWKYYFLPPGFPGTSGACHGGTNHSRDK